MFCASSVVECGGTKSRVIFWARVSLEAPSIYILIFSCSLLSPVINFQWFEFIHHHHHHHHTFEVAVGVKSVLYPELHIIRVSQVTYGFLVAN